MRVVVIIGEYRLSVLLLIAVEYRLPVLLAIYQIIKFTICDTPSGNVNEGSGYHRGV